MVSEWPIVKVGNLADSISDTHKLGKDRLVFLNTSDVLLGKLLNHSYSVVRDWPGQAKKSIRKDDILFSEIRPANGRWAYVDINADDYVVSTKLMVIRSRKDHVHPRFLYHFLTSAQTTSWLQHLAESRSGTFPQITFDQVAELELALPPLIVQVRIASFLDALDNKIELNRRMNETLEAIARALFKSWFVDFDPVRAKAESRDSGLPKPLADLFPDAFEDSELGEIPKGWRVTNWGALVSLEYGKSLRDYDRSNKAYPVYGTNGMIGSHSRPLCDHPGIIIGRKGAYRGVHFCSTPFFVIDTAFYVEPKEPIELRWAYYELLRQDINSMDSGSAIPSTSREDFYNLGVLSPPFKVQQAFAEFLNPCWARQEHNNREARTLAALRDTLLPKLISGELRLKDAQRFVGQAAS